jgi:hypothetical protein
MSKLPTRLQPFWPWFKRAHRLLSLVLGSVFRLTSPLLGNRGVPVTARTSSAETARRDPRMVTLHAGGPAESIRRPSTAGDPAGHWVFRRGEKSEVPARYTLEVQRGLLVGDFGATVTQSKVLDYQTSGYFGLSSWREHPIFLRPSIGEVRHVPGTVLSLTTRGTAVNYYHFMYDALGRLGIFEETMPDVRPDAIVVPHDRGYMKQLLELAGIDVPLLQPRAGLTYSADRLLVPSTPNQDLDAPTFVVDWLRRRLPARAGVDTPRRLYLSRGQQPNTRRYTQEAELLPELERRGFTVLDPGSLTVQEQIDIFHGAEIVLAPHGAGLTNITFCRPGTKVIEMFAPSYVHLGLWNIAVAVGLDYRYLVGDGASPDGRAQVGVLKDVEIPPARVLVQLDQALGSPA